MSWGKAQARSARQKLLRRFGDVCARCTETRGLEFAHVRPTYLSGRGRGSYARYADVRDNPSAYTLLCRACHYTLDREGD